MGREGNLSKSCFDILKSEKDVIQIGDEKIAYNFDCLDDEALI